MSYAPRHIAPLPLWQVAQFRLKPYMIRAEGRACDPATLTTTLTAAQDHIATMLAAAALAPHDGLGFVTVHLGKDADWLLCDCWVNGDALAHMLARAEKGAAAFAPPAAPLMACVWEMAVMIHERAAWISTMMTQTPDPAAYLRQTLAEGWH